MANSDAPELMNVRSKLSFFKDQIESNSKPKVAPKPLPKRPLSQRFDNGFIRSLENSVGNKVDANKKQEGAEPNVKPRPLSQMVDKNFMMSLGKSLKVPDNSVPLVPPVPPHKNQAEKTVNKQQGAHQPVFLSRSKSVNSLFQMPRPIQPPPPPPVPPLFPNLFSPDVAATQTKDREKVFQVEEGEGQKGQAEGTISTDSSDDSDHGNTDSDTDNSDNGNDSGNDLLKSLFTLALLKDVVQGANQGK